MQDLFLFKAFVRQCKVNKQEIFKNLRSLKYRRHKTWMLVYRALFSPCEIRLNNTVVNHHIRSRLFVQNLVNGNDRLALNL